MADVEAIRQEFIVPDCLAHYGHRVRTAPKGWRGPCPFCGGSTKATKFQVSADGQRAYCHACRWRGDVFSIIGEFENEDFARSLRIAADLAGVRLGERERHGHRAFIADRCPEPASNSAVRSAAGGHAGRQWAGLATDHSRGDVYLAERGLGKVSAACRFRRDGSPCLPLRSLDDGHITNVVTRRIGGESPKVLGMKGCGTYGTFGDVRHLGETHGPIVLVEGWADYLTALLWCPENLPFGVHGVGNITKVTRALLALVGERRIVFVAHRDDQHQSERAIASAMKEAVSNGIPLRRFQVLYPGNHQDLNDWHRAAGTHEFSSARGITAVKRVEEGAV